MEERLQKFLARAGVASRRAAEALIAEGRVAVNGKVVRKMGVKVDPARDEVRLDTEVVRAPAPANEVPAARAPAGSPRTAPPRPPEGAVYLALYKPVGFLTTVTDDRGRPTVMDLLPRIRGRVFPVGRLDEDSEGLLLLTNDGTLTQLLTHPRYEVAKTYDLTVRGEVTPEDIRQVERGVWLSEGRTGPGRIRIRKSGRELSHVVLTLREGRNREVRRIFARLRHPVLTLRRTGLGPLSLGDLRPGQVRRLSTGEVRALYAAAMGGPSPTPPPPAPPRGRRPGRPGPQGKQGRRSPQGRPDRPGPQGRPGRPGPQGKPGRRGPQGRPDRPGPAGRPGRPDHPSRPSGPFRPSKGGKPHGRPPRRGGRP